MKKILSLIIMLMFALSQAYAIDGILISAKDSAKEQRHVNDVGFKILNANGIQTRATFALVTSRKINAFCDLKYRSICIYRTMYERCETEDELAAILAHEIGHSVDSYNGAFRGIGTCIAMHYSPRKYEYKADKRAVDYLVNAGYNPVAMIVVLSKNGPQGHYELFSTHPLTTKRMMEIYEYIYKKYPEYLVNNAYKENIYYQNFLLTSQSNRAKFQEKVKTNSNKKVHYL